MLASSPSRRWLEGSAACASKASLDPEGVGLMMLGRETAGGVRGGRAHAAFTQSESDLSGDRGLDGKESSGAAAFYRGSRLASAEIAH